MPKLPFRVSRIPGVFRYVGLLRSGFGGEWREWWATHVGFLRFGTLGGASLVDPCLIAHFAAEKAVGTSSSLLMSWTRGPSFSVAAVTASCHKYLFTTTTTNGSDQSGSITSVSVYRCAHRNCLGVTPSV